MDGGLDVVPAATPLTSFFFFFFTPVLPPHPSSLTRPRPHSLIRPPFPTDVQLHFHLMARHLGVCVCVCQQTDGLRLWWHMASVSDTHRCATFLTLCAVAGRR